MPLERNLGMDLVRCTEAAALRAARLMGRGDKLSADQAAVDAMRLLLESVQVIGHYEIWKVESAAIIAATSGTKTTPFPHNSQTVQHTRLDRRPDFQETAIPERVLSERKHSATATVTIVPAMMRHGNSITGIHAGFLYKAPPPSILHASFGRLLR